jgi:hypothetical protein
MCTKIIHVSRALFSRPQKADARKHSLLWEEDEVARLHQKDVPNPQPLQPLVAFHAEVLVHEAGERDPGVVRWIVQLSVAGEVRQRAPGDPDPLPVGAARKVGAARAHVSGSAPAAGPQ